ncbi:50S ribosomal protein L6, partial [Lactococcus lactis]|uniref:50S ribosomal protein L6 n=1 Tax=Lactococcus lactis TaxID=1358 RepID=UPI00210A7F1C
MSRIVNKVIVIPAGLSVEVNGATVTVKGPKVELVRSFNENITLDIAQNEITVKRPNDTKQMKMLHGTTRALLAN